MAENFTFKATVASNIRTEECEAPDWDEAEKIFKSRLNPDESIIEMTNKTLYPGNGVVTG